MRYFIILIVIACLGTLCHAARRVYLKNEAGLKEIYKSDNKECHKVSSNFGGKSNKAAATGGQVIYFKDAACEKIVFTDLYGKGCYFTVKDSIQSFRAL